MSFLRPPRSQHDDEAREARAEVLRFAHLFAHVEDAQLRREAVFERLSRATPVFVYWFLHALHGEDEPAVTLADDGESEAAQRVRGMARLRVASGEVLSLGGATGEYRYEARVAVYEVAEEQGDEAVMRHLRNAPAVRELENAQKVLPKVLQAVPLGRRRALAKGFDETMIDNLAFDPDPIVIRNLLRNPRVSEQHVLRLAGRRPVSSTALVEIAQSERWRVRPRVKLALARNPYTPPTIVVALTAELAPRDLDEMVRDETLHEEARAEARAELRRRALGA